MASRPGGAADARVLDLTGLRGRARRQAWRQILADIERPFDPIVATRADPAWRAAIVELGGAGRPTRRMVALAFDGRRFDHTSAGLWIDDLIESCRAAAEHREPVWPRRPAVAATAGIEIEIADPLAIGWRAARIPAARARALLEVGRRQAAPPIATVAAAIAVVLARRGGRDDVVLEVPASLRAGPAERAAIGPATTTAAIALSLAGRPSFSEVVEQASRAICRAWAAAAGLGADPPAPTASPDASLALELAGARAGDWRETARADGGAAALAFAVRWTAAGVLVVEVGHDGVEVTADDAASIAASLDQVLGELAADPARALSGLPSDGPADLVEPAPPRTFPLTHAQERLWFLETLAPGTTANHLQRIYRLEGELDRGALERSLAALARRHDALRTVFRDVDSSPRQLVLPGPAIEHRVDTLPDEDAGERASWLAGRAAGDHARPFDLARGPLWRTRLCRMAPDDHRLILTIHHLVIDALSVLIWYRELIELYQAEVAGTVPRLARLESSMAAVAEWERSPDGQRRIADDLAFWQGELAGATRLELPIDHRRPPSHAVGRHDESELLPADRAAAVRALGRRHGATLNVTLMAAAAAFLARHTQQEDLVCVVPASRRDVPGRRNVIGLLLNLLPLRLRLDGDPTFAEIIARTHRAVHRALAHAEAPFERIVAGLGLAREPGRQPLFDVILNMVPAAERLWWGDLRVTLEGVTGSAQPCDLLIGASTRPAGSLGLVMRCRDDLFAAATSARLMARFRTLLLAAVRSPYTRLSELPVMPDDERATVVEAWNRTAVALPEATVHGLVEARIRDRPDATAVIQGQRALSYRELGRRADELAARLRGRVAAGARVGVLVRPSPELAVAALGVLKAGAVHVPLDAGQPAPRIAALASEVELVVTEPHLADRVDVAHMVLGEPAPEPESEPAQDRPSADGQGGHGNPDAIAYVVYTSGSTGRPKGVATTHRALVNQIVWFARDLPWRPGEVAMLRSSPAFVDSLWELFGPLAGGVPLVVASADEMADPRLLAAAAARHGVTRMVVVPSLLRTLLELGGGRPDFLPALTLWLATSEELKPSLVEAFQAARPASRLFNLYGASETADQVAAREVTRDDARAPRTPIGRPIANTRVYILDRAGRPVPIGVPGEICVAGVGLSDGYLGDVPAAAQARFTAIPFAPGERMYRTGDRGRWRHDGVLEYIGRLDHELKIRGIRIDPGEVESAILADPGVSAAAVTAHAGFDGEHRLTAYLVARGTSAPSPAELRRQLRTRLPEPLVPTAFVTLPALPLGPTGKLDRAALPAPQPAPVASRPPHGAIEQAVALAWEQLLGRPVGAEDDFFAAGGQSLLAAQVGARLVERFAVELPLAVLFERPTIAAQAAWLEAAVLRSPHSAIARAGEAPVPLSFAQERLAFASALAPRAPAPRVRLALRLDGALDVDGLEAAMTAIAARHDALRTVFTGDGPAARQRVVASCPRDHVFEDLSALSADEQQAAIRRHMDQERGRPFALAAGPPWRTRLLRLAERAHVLVVTMHHYVADGFSLQIWLEELDEHYAALAAGRPPAVADLTAGAADIALWQRRMADSGFWDPSRAFWRDALAGAQPLDLPLRAPRTGWSTGRSGSRRARLDGAELAALGELARAEHTTLFGVLFAAAAALLGRASGRDDVVLGTVAAGRDRPEVRPLLGLFLNPLPLRLRFEGDPRARELVGAAGRALRAALAHSDVPFERIVADVNPERRPYRQPLFDVVINHHPPPAAPRLGGLRVGHVRAAGAPVTPYELMIRTIVRGDALVIQLDYQRERFADDAVAEWLADYVGLLRRFAAAPERRLSDIRVP
ncbi:MAG TPA: amino acid adenylation domain-containing protein [Kofleriaceae bacterium]|nr:amino acid adenylation domain-containing protein [Kofleriaceae bacterium]